MGNRGRYPDLILTSFPVGDYGSPLTEPTGREQAVNIGAGSVGRMQRGPEGEEDA